MCHKARRTAETYFDFKNLQVQKELDKTKSNEEIGLILGISLGTVKKHIEHIFQKLGVESRTAAAARALSEAAA